MALDALLGLKDLRGVKPFPFTLKAKNTSNGLRKIKEIKVNKLIKQNESTGKPNVQIAPSQIQQVSRSFCKAEAGSKVNKIY